MLNKEIKHITQEEYLNSERKADIKSEYYNGEIFAMSGASLNHNIITVNILTSLQNQLNDKGCRPFGSDMRINVSENGLFTYPDISVVFGEIKFFDDEQDTVTNPKVIFEVLSKTTQNYDRGGKFKLYRDIKTLEDYILVSQDTVFLEHFHKQKDERWILNEIKNVNDELILNSLNFKITIREIYKDIKL